jgi:hypothetical protein
MGIFICFKKRNGKKRGQPATGVSPTRKEQVGSIGIFCS